MDPSQVMNRFSKFPIIFFDIKDYQIIGWQTEDLYQNLSITFLSSIMINQKIKKNIFIVPMQN